LWDSIINFGESLPKKEYNEAVSNSEKADLCLAIGSSLRISAMPERTKWKGGKLVIINLQKTPLDNIADLCINGLVEPVIEKLMLKLNIEIPQWKIVRRVRFLHPNKGGLQIQSLDNNGIIPYTIFKKVTIVDYITVELFNEPFYWKREVGDKFEIVLKFQGHYQEPDLTLNLEKDKYLGKIFILEYNPFKKEWCNIQTIDDKNYPSDCIKK